MYYYEPKLGVDIVEAVKDAKKEITSVTGRVQMEFNGVELEIHSNSRPEDIRTIYHLKLQLKEQS